MTFAYETNEEYAQKIAQARDYLDAGDVSKAGDILEHVAFKTWDPEQLQQIHDLGEQGLGKAGRFGKGKWKHIISTTDMALQTLAAQDAEPQQ